MFYNVGKAIRMNAHKGRDAEADTMRFNLQRFEKFHDLYKEHIDIVAQVNKLSEMQLHIMNELIEAAWKDGFACGGAGRRLR